MLTSIEAMYHADGTLEFAEPPPEVQGASRVIVTFLGPGDPHDLRTYGISPTEAAEIRARMHTFIAGWDDPEMDGYDDYDAEYARLQATHR